MNRIAIEHHGPEPSYRGGALTQSEYEMAELDCVQDGRDAVRNALLRTGGEGWMRQLTTLPLYVEPLVDVPEPTPRCWTLSDDLGRSLVTLALTLLAAWVTAGIVAAIVSRMH